MGSRRSLPVWPGKFKNASQRRKPRPGYPKRPYRPIRPRFYGGSLWPYPVDSGAPAAAPEQGSEFVRWVQSTLNQVLGINLPVDGIMGVETRSAVRSFQSKNGIPVDGIVGPDTKSALLAARSGGANNGGARNGGDGNGSSSGDQGNGGGQAAGQDAPAPGGQDGEVLDTIRSLYSKFFKKHTIQDRTHLTPKSKRIRTRDPKTVYALVLHQMAFSRGSNPTRYDNVTSHYAILPDGTILQLHPVSAYLYASNGFNKGSVAVEFAGNFPNTKGRCWQAAKFGCHTLTQAQIDAGRYLIRHLISEIGLTHVLAHRQSSGTRENDPGPDIWYHVGQWAVDNLGLKDGGPGFKVDSGNPIPDVWRTWGRNKPQPEMEAPGTASYEAEEEIDPESPEHTRWLRQALNRALGLHLPTGKAGGAALRSALRSFQRRSGMPTDGELTEEVEEMLIAAGAPPHRHPVMYG